ncbi:pectin lyase-like protein [Fomes fomentarius]|nr:pectin lyase-like protein [Fomes fomentarius]
MSHSKYLLLFCLLAGFLATPALPWVIKKGNVCTVIPHEDGRDDSRSIVRAFRQCNKDASVVFLNRTYNIARVMATHGLQNVTVDIRGTLLWSTDTTYWINTILPLGYLNMSVAWDFGGDNIFWTGHGHGTFDGNGQVWYDLAKGISNMPGRPINLVIRNSTNFTMQGMRFVQSQFWTMATFNAENVLLEDILIRSVSNSSRNLQAPQDGTQNTDGIDTFYTNNITLRRWDVTEGDDQVAPKANTSNMLIQDSHFHGGNGVSIGSIGQYLGKYEFIENLTAERITCDGCQHVGYVKTWTGIQKGIPPNGGGGGVGFARNIVFRDFNVTNITHGIAQISQCTSFDGQTGDCDSSTFRLSNITWTNITGSVANNLLASLQCSAAAPCTDITIAGVDGLAFNATVNATTGTVDPPGVECTNLQVGAGGLPCNGDDVQINVCQVAPPFQC